MNVPPRWWIMSVQQTIVGTACSRESRKCLRKSPSLCHPPRPRAAYPARYRYLQLETRPGSEGRIDPVFSRRRVRRRSVNGADRHAPATFPRRPVRGVEHALDPASPRSYRRGTHPRLGPFGKLKSKYLRAPLLSATSCSPQSDCVKCQVLFTRWSWLFFSRKSGVTSRRAPGARSIRGCVRTTPCASPVRCRSRRRESVR